MTIAKVIEITSESDKSYEDAVMRGIDDASQTVDNIRSAWVKDHEILIGKGQGRAHRVNLKVTFVVNNGEKGAD